MTGALSDAEAVVRVLVVVLGPAMGSCAALLAERLPRAEPVVLARSACRACGTRLGWCDLVPLLSWLWLRGRCRHCGARIPARLWQAEVAGLGLGLGAALVAPTAAQAVLGALLLWCLLALALADLQHFRLPDPLTAALGGLGLALAGVGDGSGWPPLAERLGAAGLGAALGGGAFWALRHGYARATGREGLGPGDVKLMAGIGAALGPAALPMVTLLAGVSALALAALRARLRGRRLRARQRLPFGAFLALAAAAVWLVPALVP